MRTHKISADRDVTVCGLNIRGTPDDLSDPVTDKPKKTTCPDCLEIMGEANSKQQSGTYTRLPIQPWHFAETNSLSFLEGCIVKRVCRHRQKDGAQDIDKAIEELKLLKKHLYEH